MINKKVVILVTLILLVTATGVYAFYGDKWLSAILGCPGNCHTEVAKPKVTR